MKTKTLISFLIMIASLFVMNAVITGAQEITPRLWLSPESLQAQPGQEVTVTVNIADAIGVYGGSFKLAYDPEALEVVSADNYVVSAGEFFEGRPSFTLKNSANAQEGMIEYALTLTQPAEPVSGDGVLGTITFRALSEATVNIMPVEARLLSPEFTEVDGRMIAQRINEVEARLQGTMITVGENATTLATSTSAEPVVSSDFDEPMIVLSKADVLVLAAAGVFFIAGLALFVLTMTMYARMNTQVALRRSGQYI